MEGEDLMKENGVAYVAKRLTEMIKDLDNRSVLEGAKERLPYNFDSEPNTRQVSCWDKPIWDVWGRFWMGEAKQSRGYDHR
uniref:Uncharacterized protein n=1 Tax=Salix viminalis TaxID=40686 RepID=A0A6N2LFG9_SALVM